MRDYLGQLRYRLLELGCPVGRMRRMVQEVADHRDDLIQAGLAQGLPAGDAQYVAERRLGSPLELAKRLVVVRRESSWFGRHFLVTFGFLPLLAFPLLWASFLAFGLWLECGIGFRWDAHKLHLVGDDPVAFRHWANIAYGTDYLALGLAAATFCWLARRSAVSFSWMTIACLIGSIYAAISFTHVAPHNFSLGISHHIRWTRAFMPLLAVAMVYLNHWYLLRNARHSTVV